MATIIEVDNVCRFTVVGHWTNGRKWANDFDMLITGVGAGTTRSDAVADQAEIISDQYVSHILANVTNNVILDGVKWLDLDPVSVGSGMDTSDAGATGGSTDPSSPPQVAYLYKKICTGLPRGARNGKVFVPGVAENQVDEDGNVNPAYLPAFGSFKADINQDAGIVAPIYNSRLVVIHLEPVTVPPAPIRTGTTTNVATMVIDGKVATQRRRLR